METGPLRPRFLCRGKLCAVCTLLKIFSYSRAQRTGVSTTVSRMSTLYPLKHSGPVFICGSAWCLHEDLEQAKKIHPDAPVIAVNDAAFEVKAFALFSYHPQRFIEKPYSWIDKQRKKFGNDFTVHGSKFIEDMPFVNYWWEGARGGGTSAWGAMKIAKLMGFENIIFCGCPMSPGNYTGYRLGKIMARREVIDRYRKEIEDDKDWHEGCCSMSGWTRGIFGEP